VQKLIMSDKRKILVQLDSDVQPSLFDRVVAIDAGADELLSYGQVKKEQVKDLVHGCIFTRGPKDLSRTAIYIGGSDVVVAEELLAEAKKYLLPQFGLSVSLMLDANGANTTSAAAVRSASRHVELNQSEAVVIGAGPVGQRVALLLTGQGSTVYLADRLPATTIEACRRIKERSPEAKITPVIIREANDVAFALENASLIIAAGPAGKQVLSSSAWQQAPKLKAVIDLNAVPPAGIEGIEVMDAGKFKGNVACYGALGVGNLKMKIHKAAIASLFTSNQLVLDSQAIYDLSASV
jgi:hypothetical protein